MTLINTYENLLWPGFIMIAVGGFMSHIANVRMPRAIPSATLILMSLFAGLYASSSSTFLFIDYLHVKLGLSFQTIFMVWLGIFIMLHVPRLLILTPDYIPAETDENYTVYKNNAFWKSRVGPEAYIVETAENENVPLSYTELLRDYRIYCVFLAYSAFSLRLVTFSAWIGSGWPKWISDDQFMWTMNDILGYGNISAIIINLIPGIFLRLMDQKYRRWY